MFVEGTPVTARIPHSVKRICKALQDAGYEAYIVGGCVRDLIRCEVPHDWDITTNATPEQVTAIFTKVIPTGIDFGTVTVMIQGEGYEVTTYRADGRYTDGRRPDSVQFSKSLMEDLARRDFTMNAIAMNPITGSLVESHGGTDDIAAGVIRTVGDPKERFMEDGLRVMRACRFAATFGYSIHDWTLRAMADPEVLAVLRKVSPERIRDELLKGLAQNASEMLKHLKATDVISVVIPGLVRMNVQDWADLRYTLKHLVPSCSLAAICIGIEQISARPGKAKEWLEWLRLPRKDIQFNSKVASAFMRRPLPPSSDASLRWFASNVGADVAMTAVGIGELVDSLDPLYPTGLADRLEGILISNPPLAIKDLVLNGNEVAEILGIKPGKVLGEVLRELLSLVLDYPERNTPEDLRKALDDIRDRYT